MPFRSCLFNISSCLSNGNSSCLGAVPNKSILSGAVLKVLSVTANTPHTDVDREILNYHKSIM